jgi:hypothetical protein
VAIAKKTAKKVAKKASPAKKSTSSSKSKPVSKMSGEQIEKELALAHKVLSQAAFQLNYMLSTRRVSPKRIAEATKRAEDAAAYMQRLQSVIQTYAQGA